MITRFLTVALIGAATPAFGQGDPALPASDAEGRDILVTASRSGEAVPLADVPASATLLSAEDLDLRQTRIVSDVLRDVPGVAVNRVPGGLGQVRVRGSESNHVLVLIDGIEAADAFQGEFDFNTLLADENVRIEVLRGQQSSLYGSDAIGGVIHYITLTGREAPGISVRAEGGSLGTAAGGARVAGFGDTFDYAVSASGFRNAGHPVAVGGVRDVGSTLANGTAKVTWAPSDAFKLTGVGRYGYTDTLVTNTEGDPASPLFGQAIDSPGAHVATDSFYGLLRADLSLADGRWTSALTGQIGDVTHNAYAGGTRDFSSEGRRYKGSFETSLRLGDDRVAHRLTGAIDGEREEFANTTPSPFVFNGRRATTNWGFVGQYELTVADALSAGASVRRDENDRFDDATTWRVQAGYRLPGGLRIRGAYGTGIKNPGYYELFGFSDGRYIGNPDLRPEKSKGWEAGADWQLAGDRASIGATWFDSRLEGEIFVTYPAPTFVATPANRTTRSRQQGIEAFASARPIPQLRLDLAYTWLDADENDVREVRRPAHIGSVNATVLSADERFSGTLTLRYNGRQTDVAFTDPSFVPVPVALREYVLMNLNAEYRLTDRLALFGRVENVLGEEYQEVFSYAGAPRVAVAGLRARF